MSVCFHGFNRLGDRYLELLPVALWQSTLVAAIVLVAVFFLRSRSAHLRYGLLMVVLAKFAIPGIVQAPWSPFPRIAATGQGSVVEWEVPAALPEAVFKEPAEQPDQRPGLIDSKTLPGVTGETDFAADHLEPAVHPSADPLRRPRLHASDFPHGGDRKMRAQDGSPQSLSNSLQPAAARLTGAGWLLLLQLTGTALFSLALVVDAVRLRRLIGDADPAEELHQRALEGLIQRMKMRSIPRLLVSDRCRFPFAAGLLRPLIMLPRRSLKRLDPTELEAVLGHELLHLQRRDLWVNQLQLWVQAFWWWHPLVWYLNRQIKTVREECCDDALLVQGWVDAGRYCETLLAIARDAVAARPSSLSVSMAAAHPLGRRIRRIMNPQVSRRGRIGFGLGLVVGILAIVVLPTVSQDQNSDNDVGGAVEAASEAVNDSAADVPRSSLQVFDNDNRPLAGVHLAVSYGRVFVPFWMGSQQVWSTTTDDEGRAQDVFPNKISVDEPIHAGRLWIYRPGVSLAAFELPRDQSFQNVPDQIRLAGAGSTLFTVETADSRPASGTRVRIRSFRCDGGSAWVPENIADAMSVVADDQGIVRLPKVDGGWIDSVELTRIDQFDEHLRQHRCDSNFGQAVRSFFS